MNISSIVVKTTKDSFNAVKASIREIKGCEIYIEDEATAQLIVVLEAPSTEEEMAINKTFRIFSRCGKREYALCLSRRGIKCTTSN